MMSNEVSKEVQGAADPRSVQDAQAGREQGLLEKIKRYAIYNDFSLLSYQIERAEITEDKYSSHLTAEGEYKSSGDFEVRLAIKFVLRVSHKAIMTVDMYITNINHSYTKITIRNLRKRIVYKGNIYDAKKERQRFTYYLSYEAFDELYDLINNYKKRLNNDFHKMIKKLVFVKEAKKIFIKTTHPPAFYIDTFYRIINSETIDDFAERYNLKVNLKRENGYYLFVISRGYTLLEKDLLSKKDLEVAEKLFDIAHTDDTYYEFEVYRTERDNLKRNFVDICKRIDKGD